MCAYHRKEKYFIASLPDGELAYSYSAKQLQAELNELFAGQKLKAIYVGLEGYLETLRNRVNVIDLTYMGGITLIVFDTVVLEFVIHVEGMIAYRCFPAQELKPQEKYDYPPEDLLMSDRYFFDIAGHELAYEYKDKVVKRITVNGTDTWGFSQPSFDEEIAREATEKRDLPTDIVLHTDEFNICFEGDDLEYYYIVFERARNT